MEKLSWKLVMQSDYKKTTSFSYFEQSTIRLKNLSCFFVQWIFWIWFLSTNKKKHTISIITLLLVCGDIITLRSLEIFWFRRLWVISKRLPRINIAVHKRSNWSSALVSSLHVKYSGKRCPLNQCSDGTPVSRIWLLVVRADNLDRPAHQICG